MEVVASGFQYACLISKVQPVQKYDFMFVPLLNDRSMIKG